MKNRDGLICRISGAISGILLLLPCYWAILAPLQLIAFCITAWYCLKVAGKTSKTLVFGLYMSLCYMLPQLITLRMHAIVSLILLLYFMAIILIICWAIGKCINSSPILGSIAAGALLAVTDWISITVIPIWGSAQSIVRCWSSWPGLIMFTSLTGLCGVMFVIGIISALTANYILRPNEKRKVLIAASVLIAVVTLINLVQLNQKPISTIKIASVGWIVNGSDGQSPHSEQGFDELFVQPVTAAANQGAKFVASGELGFYLDKYDAQHWIEKFAQVAIDNNVFLAVGYFDGQADLNRMMYISPQGKLIDKYAKTYLTPFEPWGKGDGDLKIIDIDGIGLGGMICHDDNFTKMTRYYGRTDVAVVALPTADWSTVRKIHMQSSISRAIEGRYAVVRAAANGISAVISAKGKVLASMDHYTQGPGYVIAEVDVYNHKTFYSLTGDWIVILSTVYLLLILIRLKLSGPRSNHS